MLTLMFSSAMALTCDAGDIPCNTANAVRDLVNAQRAGAIGDGLSGKRSTQFVLDRILELEGVASAAGCQPLGISAVRIDDGAITGEWVDVDFLSGTPLAAGSYVGGTTGNNEFDGDWDAGTFGNWGRYHFATGKLGALRDGAFPGPGMVMGGIARINSRHAVAWGLHGFCPDGTDVAGAFTPYMPQLDRYAVPAPNLGECSFDVLSEPGGPATYGECECVNTVCDMDPFCCEVAWDGICVNEASEFCAI